MRNYARLARATPAFLGFAVTLTLLSSFGQTFFVSLFVPEFLETFSLSNGAFGSIYAAATLAGAVLLPWTGRRMDRTPLPAFTQGIVTLLGVSALVVAVAVHPALLLLGLFGLRLGGPGLAGYAALAATARRFGAERGRALGVAGLGFSVGEAALPLAGTVLLATVGWRATWAVMAGVTLLGAGPLLRALLRRDARRGSTAGDPDPAQPGSRTDSVPPGPSGTAKAAAAPPATAAPAAATPATATQWNRGQMLRDPRFWAALPASLLPAFWATGIFLYQTALADASGWSPSLMASAFSAFALTRIASSLVGGSMVDRFSARRIFPFSTLPLGVGLVVLLAFEGAWVPFAFMAALGVTTGFSGNARVALFAELYGVRHLGALKSLMGALLAASTAASPVLVGVILDSGAGMDRMLVGAVASVVVGAVASVAVLGHREPRG